MSKKGEDPLQSLCYRNDIIITKADKEDVVIIVDIDDYVQEANRQFENKKVYTKLTMDATEIN